MLIKNTIYKLMSVSCFP